ncbi:hypothetical protein FKY78_02865 [Enterococcus faecalis]|nr:hypothetical protein [Enterococcus faecalis]EGO7550513.1 hypothetical protein [Enterococcus faecalis]EGO8325318.1 hypothetical protein [Enterococcus faecalis]EGO9396093.1 hypothetical protein [Enterococcus faecalis]EGO9465987.1 hypothetical protein [Enterococcus faecalis]
MLYGRVIENLQEFSMPAEEQIKKLKGFTVADEIASDFSDITLNYAKELFENNWITLEQYQQFLDIDEKLDDMSKNKALWCEEALKNASEWKKCREVGAELLISLGY